MQLRWRQVTQEGSARYSHVVEDLARADLRDVRRLFRSGELGGVTAEEKCAQFTTWRAGPDRVGSLTPTLQP